MARSISSVVEIGVTIHSTMLLLLLLVRPPVAIVVGRPVVTGPRWAIVSTTVIVVAVIISTSMFITSVFGIPNRHYPHVDASHFHGKSTLVSVVAAVVDYVPQQVQ
jgi:hypothetical protein